jgi:pimeloyl-ACP methyl ester carboxylesterase
MSAVVVLMAAVLGQGASPRTVGDVYRPGECSVWAIEIDGKRAGQHWSRYDGIVDLLGTSAHHFTAGVRFEKSPAGGLEPRFLCELWTDVAGHPIKQDLRVMIGEVFSRVELLLSGETVTARATEGPSVRDRELKTSKGSYLLANNFLSHLELIFALNPVEQGGPRSFDLLSANVLQTFPLRVEWVKTFAEPSGERTVSGHVLQDSLGETFQVTDQGRVLRMEVPAQKLVMRRSDEEPEPIVIEPPAPPPPDDRFDREEVTIAYGAVSLAGTITKPKGASGRQRSVFFVSGSGLQDRQGFSSGLDVGTHEILDHLTAAGFLVLRVDDRGAGKSTGPLADLSFDDLVADARACVEFLRRRSDVDPARVAVIGHSEGGLTAEILASEGGLAAIVLMAGPGRSVIEVIADQNRQALDEAGVTGKERKDAIQKQHDVMALLCSDRELKPEDLAPEVRQGLAIRAWLKSHATKDPIAILRRVHCPVFIAQGEKDFQVSPERDAGALERALRDAGHPDHELRVFAGLDHLFKRTPGERSRLADYMKTRPVDPEFLAALTQWLQAHVP